MRESLFPEFESPVHKQTALFDSLMLRRVRHIVLVASEYDSFTFEEDGRLTEALYSEFMELNLRYAPNVSIVSTFDAAIQKVRTTPVDLVIGILRFGDIGIGQFAAAMKRESPDLPIVMLAYNTRELAMLQALGSVPGIDRIFVWLGDVRLFLAIIKNIEDQANADDDILKSGVQCIIVVEDNIRFYSSYLPLLYTELVKQTQSIMSDALTRMDRMLRMRARPKILLATSFEEAETLFKRYQENVTGVILDAAFPRNGRVDPKAGAAFAAIVRKSAPDRPILIQSSDIAAAKVAHDLGAVFLDKRSDALLASVRQFVNEHLGFGEFVFRRPSGEEVLCAMDLTSFEDALVNAPDESIYHHANRNDFSTWLKARGEFELAKDVLALRAQDFKPDDLRQRILGYIKQHRERALAGVVADFTNRTFMSPSSSFVRIGKGSLGGKGRGLAFMHNLIERYQLKHRIDDLEISVPPTAVLTTDVFDQFMLENDLTTLALSEADDDEITKKFIDARLPKLSSEQLRTFLERVTDPLAIRSSSLLEDASFQPFAGIYRTYMIPNNNADIEVRWDQLATAVKLVFASTYYANAKAYISATPNRLEEEKMAVVIQTISGRSHGSLLYPDMAGVARSYNFYPLEGMAPEDGVASVVLGLGKTVVEGGRCIRFSPPHPRKLYQFSSTEDTLASAQRTFLAMDMSNETPTFGYRNESPNLVEAGLDVADRDGILPLVGSVYSPENDAIYDGTSRPGIPLVTMAGVLKAGVYPLPEALTLILKVGSRGFASPVEIEFAANMRKAPDLPHTFSCLQIRPVVVAGSASEVSIESVDMDNAICFSDMALGNGIINGITDILFVRPATFDRRQTVAIADEIGNITARIRSDSRGVLLIGPGRWGTQDRWLGIPVVWRQIAGVRCIVETDMEDITVEPSQGTHFFQNITSFGIGYFTVSLKDGRGVLDTAWLTTAGNAVDGPYTRHITLDAPLEIAVNGRKHIGVIMKPGESITPKQEQAG